MLACHVHKDIPPMMKRSLFLPMLLTLGLVLSSFARGAERPGRAEMEKHFLPLLMDADKIEILAVYPLAKEYLAAQPDRMELSMVFGLTGEDASKKMTDADKKMAALARNLPVVEGHPVLGTVTIREPEDIKALLGTLRKMAIASDDDEVEDEDCHDPRHALRITKGNRTLHFSICFDCGNTFLRGVPQEAEKGAQGFHHFKDEFREILEKRLTAQGVTFLKAPTPR